MRQLHYEFAASVDDYVFYPEGSVLHVDSVCGTEELQLRMHSSVSLQCVLPEERPYSVQAFMTVKLQYSNMMSSHQWHIGGILS
jgi:hypothetical protein